MQHTTYKFVTNSEIKYTRLAAGPAGIYIGYRGESIILTQKSKDLYCKSHPNRFTNRVSFEFVILSMDYGNTKL